MEKLVWDPEADVWVDGVTASLDEIVKFQCNIHNSGGRELTNIKATDILPAFLEYANSATVNSAPWEPVAGSPGEFNWDLDDMVLEPGESIVIEFDARVIECGKGLNTQAAEAECEGTGIVVSGEDTAGVKTIEAPDLIVTKIKCDRPNNRIGYVIKNVGCTTVPAGHITGLWVNGTQVDKDGVPGPLLPGDTYESWFSNYKWPYCNTLNNVFVWTDIDDDVVEFDENNNRKRGGCISAELEWTWNSTTVEPDYDQVMMAPVVADLNGDNIPDVIFSTFSVAGGWQGGGILRAINGAGGSEIFSVTSPNCRVQAGAEPAVADIDNDGKPEIMVSKDSGEIICFENDGTHKWTSTTTIGRIGIAVADLDEDGIPEIIAGRTVFNNNGTVRWTGTAGSSYLSVVADLDLDPDGLPEVVTGATAYRYDGTIYWTTPHGGRPAIGNFDDDPYPEIVVVGGNQVCLKEHDGTLKWGPVNIPGRGNGPPVVADIDGDGELEIGVGGRVHYVTFETDGSIKWIADIVDTSSWAAGSSAFDFDGDGSYEIVYSDHYFHRIFRGIDGAVLFEVPGPSGTLMEQPIIVDVDNDGHVELVFAVFAVNNYHIPGNTGIEVYGNDTCWPDARKIWNQHTYHITNINDDATVPTVETNNWEVFNNYRTQSAALAELCECDLNHDGRCDMQDWLLFGEDWGRTDCGTPPGSGNPPNDCECDLNNDGRCDMQDWLLFGEDWGRTDCPIWEGTQAK